jgi:hypothetical protein
MLKRSIKKLVVKIIQTYLRDLHLKSENNKGMGINRTATVTVFFVKRQITAKNMHTNNLNQLNPLMINLTPAQRNKEKKATAPTSSFAAVIISTKPGSIKIEKGNNQRNGCFLGVSSTATP